MFDHFAKCGGSTIRDWIKSHTLKVQETPNIKTWVSIERPIVMGHYATYSNYKDYPHYLCTLIRNPTERVWSYYNYIRNKQDHPLHTTCHKPIKDLLDLPEFNNDMVRYFNGSLDIYNLVGCLERIEMFMYNISKILNIPTTNTKSNVNKTKPDMPIHTRNIITEANTEDWKFYTDYTGLTC